MKTGLIQRLGEKIISVVLDNFDYLKQNPSHLAWIMMNYELIHRIEEDSPNPKDAILDRKDRGLLSEEEVNLLYDSWAVTVSNYCEFPDTNPDIQLESKPNKILKEWIDLFTDDRYRFRDLFADEFSVKDYLLCGYGTGYKWNKEGFIANIGPSGIDEIIFAGYTRCEQAIDQKIREKIIKTRSHQKIKQKAEEYLKRAADVAERIKTGESWIDAVDHNFKKEKSKLNQRLEELLSQFPDDLADLAADIRKKLLEPSAPEPREKIYSELCIYSNLVTMPANAHQSYVAASIEIAKEIIAGKSTLESKNFARRFIKQWD